MKQNLNVIKKANSIIPFKSLNDKVIIEVLLKKPSIIIEDSTKLQIVSCKVCSLGDKVYNLNLGDEVVIDDNPTLKQQLIFRWNYDKEGKIIEKDGMIKNYFAIRVQDIIGIILNDF